MIGAILGGWIVASLIFTLVWVGARLIVIRAAATQISPAVYFEHAKRHRDRGYMPSAT